MPASSEPPARFDAVDVVRAKRDGRELGDEAYDEGDYVNYSSVSGLSRYSSSSRIPIATSTADAGLALFELNRMAAEVPVDAPYLATDAALRAAAAVEFT